MRLWGLAMLMLCLATGSVAPALAQDGDALAVGLGVFSVEEEQERTAELRLEYHPGYRLFEGSLWQGFDGFAPVVGLMANADGGVFGYGGLQTDIALTERWTVTPAAGLGGYHEGGSSDLGGVFQFHLGLTLAYGFENGDRLGLTWAHISNGGVHDANPAANSVLLTYRVGFNSLF